MKYVLLIGTPSQPEPVGQVLSISAQAIIGDNPAVRLLPLAIFRMVLGETPHSLAGRPADPCQVSPPSRPDDDGVTMPEKALR